MKATPEEYDFHCRILARNDPIAFSMLAEQVYTSLVQRVQRRAGKDADSAMVEEAVGTALLDYRDAPERYDPNRMDLQSYLAMTAYRDFQNAQSKEQRMAKHIKLLPQNELQQLEIEDSTATYETRESEVREQELWQAIDATFPDPIERQIVLLMLNKVHSYEPYARLLDLDTLPRHEQRNYVDRIKERLRKRLRRHIATVAQQFDL